MADPVSLIGQTVSLITLSRKSSAVAANAEGKEKEQN